MQTACSDYVQLLLNSISYGLGNKANTRSVCMPQDCTMQCSSISLHQRCDDPKCVAPCSVADLMQSALLDLGGVKGAVKLKAAGYTAAAIQEGASDTISPLDLRLVGFGQQNAAKVTLPPRLGKEPTYEGTAATGMLDAQHGVGPGALCAASDDVELFRHGIKPLMQMKAGQDIPLVILGTHKVCSDKVGGCDTGGIDCCSVVHALGKGCIREGASRHAPMGTELLWSLLKDAMIP